MMKENPSFNFHFISLFINGEGVEEPRPWHWSAPFYHLSETQGGSSGKAADGVFFITLAGIICHVLRISNKLICC